MIKILSKKLMKLNVLLFKINNFLIKMFLEKM